MSNQRKSPGRYSLKSSGDLFYLALGSAIGIGNLLVLPSLMSRYGVTSVFLLHLFMVLLITLPLILSEMLWSRWLQRSLRSSMDLLPRFGKYVWVLAVVLWIDITPTYMVEFSKIILSFFRFDWRHGEDRFLMNHEDLGLREAQIVYLVAAVILCLGAWVASREKRRMVTLYQWGLGIIGLSVIVLFSLTLVQMDLSFILSRIQILDFSRFGMDQLMEITNYSLFSMSAGMGVYFCYVNYASQVPYESASESSLWKRPGGLLRLALRVLALDLIVSVLAVCLFLPHVDSTGMYPVTDSLHRTPEFFALYLFPKYLSELPQASLGLVAYYALILTAGFLSLISLIDAALWTFDRELNLAYWKKIVLLIFLLGLFLAGPLLPLIRDMVSEFGSVFLLPISALAWSLCAGWAMPKKMQVMLFGRGPRVDGFFILWRFSVRWFVPLLFATFFILRGLRQSGM